MSIPSDRVFAGPPSMRVDWYRSYMESKTPVQRRVREGDPEPLRTPLFADVQETTMAREDHEDLRGTTQYEAPLGGKPYTTDLHHRSSAGGTTTECLRPLAEAVSDNDVQFRLALTRALQIDIDNMCRLRRTWARGDREAAEHLRGIIDSGLLANSQRRDEDIAALRLAVRKLDELATAQEERPRIFALVDRDGTMVEIRAPALLGADTTSAGLVLRRAAELGAVRISSFLTTMNTPLADFHDPAPAQRSIRPEQIIGGHMTEQEVRYGVRPERLADKPRPAPAPTQGDIEGLQASQSYLQTQLAEAEQALRNLVAAVSILQVNGHDITSLDARLSTAVESAQEILAEYEPTDLATRSPRY